MIRSILGRKVGMTQIFDEAGAVVPVTVVKAGPCVVTAKRTLEKNGYEAIQVGFEDVKESRLTRPRAGEFKKAGVAPKRVVREFRGPGAAEMEVGAEINVSTFAPGDLVDVIGQSKGKGFQGVVKRYHWHGADMTHGSMIHRKPQSAGATDPARIFKNTGRPGHMGDERVTVKRLRVAAVDAERGLLLIRGAVPGANGGLLTVREAK
jgi:large subunit ribosomal protein L3